MLLRLALHMPSVPKTQPVCDLTGWHNIEGKGWNDHIAALRATGALPESLMRSLFKAPCIPEPILIISFVSVNNYQPFPSCCSSDIGP